MKNLSTSQKILIAICLVFIGMAILANQKPEYRHGIGQVEATVATQTTPVDTTCTIPDSVIVNWDRKIANGD